MAGKVGVEEDDRQMDGQVARERWKFKSQKEVVGKVMGKEVGWKEIVEGITRCSTLKERPERSVCHSRNFTVKIILL